jgi:glycosyltransferase involved in cell wall biosynthesis
MPTIEPSGRDMSETLKPSVSVVIPVYNGGDAFVACLESLRALDPQPLEVIVVGDADTDGSSEAALKSGASVLRTTSRQGPANARNLGAQKASGDILFFFDADVIIPESAVGRVSQAFLKDPGLSALFGSYDDAPAQPDFLSQYRNLLHHYVHQKGNENSSTFWAGCGAIRRKIFLALNGFNTGYKRPSIEDIELGYRLKKKGHHILLDKNLLVKHLKKWEVLSVLRTDFFNRALPWARLIFFEGGFIDDLNLKIEGRFSVACIFVLMISLILTFKSTFFLAPAFSCGLLLCLFNRDLYRFFLRKRGALFMMSAVLWHWLYYLYSGIAFGAGLCAFGWRRLSRSLR